MASPFLCFPKTERLLPESRQQPLKQYFMFFARFLGYAENG
jgi:hypothetical protein